MWGKVADLLPQVEGGTNFGKIKNVFHGRVPDKMYTKFITIHQYSRNMEFKEGVFPLGGTREGDLKNPRKNIYTKFHEIK